MIEVNGKEILLQETNLETLLEKLGYRRERVAVELNGRIVKREEREKTEIKDGDVLEVVSFVGGRVEMKVGIKL